MKCCVRLLGGHWGQNSEASSCGNRSPRCRLVALLASVLRDRGTEGPTSCLAHLLHSRSLHQLVRSICCRVSRLRESPVPLSRPTYLEAHLPSHSKQQVVSTQGCPDVWRVCRAVSTSRLTSQSDTSQITNRHQPDSPSS